MSSLIPNRFLFKFEFPLLRCSKPPRLDGKTDHWDPAFLLPPLQDLDGKPAFASVYATWDEEGLYIGCNVPGKTRLPQCNADQFWKGDNLRIMTDMRDTRTIKRATRFCQQFYFLPTGGPGKTPVAASAEIHRATGDAPPVRPGQIPIAAHVSKTGYSLTAQIPERWLNGFDPAENPRVGFYYMLEDTEHGQQYLTVGDDLNWWIDPSTWPTAVLTSI